MNIIVPTKDKENDISIFCIVVADENTNIEANIPSFAKSTVAAVVGETNLFLLICCIIRPLMLNPIPATTILINLGTLLVNNISIFVLSKANISANLISVTPTNRDKIDSMTNIITKYFFFIFSPLNASFDKIYVC